MEEITGFTQQITFETELTIDAASCTPYANHTRIRVYVTIPKELADILTEDARERAERYFVRVARPLIAKAFGVPTNEVYYAGTGIRNHPGFHLIFGAVRLIPTNAVRENLKAMTEAKCA